MYVLSLMRAGALDLSIESLPGNRLLAMRCENPAQSTRLCFDYVELGYQWPGCGRNTDRVTSVDLQHACRAPSVGIALAMRRCVFPVINGWYAKGSDTYYPVPAPDQRCWVGGVWCNRDCHPVAAVLRESRCADPESEGESAPLVLHSDDLAWWLDPHLVDRSRLLAMIAQRHRH